MTCTFYTQSTMVIFMNVSKKLDNINPTRYDTRPRALCHNSANGHYPKMKPSHKKLSVLCIMRRHKELESR